MQGSRFVALFERAFSKSAYAASSSLGRNPARLASVINISRLNLSHLPRTRSDTRDCAIPRTLAASACVQPFSSMVRRSFAIRSARMASSAASSGGKPKSRNTFPLDSVMRISSQRASFFFVVSLLTACSGGPRGRCLPGGSSASFSEKHGARKRHWHELLLYKYFYKLTRKIQWIGRYITSRSQGEG